MSEATSPTPAAAPETASTAAAAPATPMPAGLSAAERARNAPWSLHAPVPQAQTMTPKAKTPQGEDMTPDA